MSDIQITVSDDVAEDVVEQLENKAQRMENVLQSFRSNDLTELPEYENVKVTKMKLVEDIEYIEEQIEEQKPEGLGQLFG